MAWLSVCIIIVKSGFLNVGFTFSTSRWHLYIHETPVWTQNEEISLWSDCNKCIKRMPKQYHNAVLWKPELIIHHVCWPDDNFYSYVYRKYTSKLEEGFRTVVLNSRPPGHIRPASFLFLDLGKHKKPFSDANSKGLHDWSDGHNVIACGLTNLNTWTFESLKKIFVALQYLYLTTLGLGIAKHHPVIQVQVDRPAPPALKYKA